MNHREQQAGKQRAEGCRGSIDKCLARKYRPLEMLAYPEHHLVRDVRETRITAPQTTAAC